MSIQNQSFRTILYWLMLVTIVLFGLVFKSAADAEVALPGPILLGEQPRGIAINAGTNQAVVTNEKSNTVSIVDLGTQTVLSVIPVGTAPKGVAVDRNKNLALIGNSKDDTVSIIDLNQFNVVATVPVGKSPEGMAINSSTHRAAVANRLDHTISVLDLNARQVIATVPAGMEPVDVAILEAPAHPGLALVINSGDRNIAVIDFSTFEVTRTIALEKKPSSIDVNPNSGLAVATNVQENSITVLNTQTGQASIIPVGKHPIDTAIDTLGNRALVICDEDRTLVLVDLNAEEIVATFDLNKLPKGVAVNDLTGVAAVIDDKTDSLTLIQLPVAPGLPKVAIASPADNAVLNASPVTVTGTVTNSTDVTVNGVAASVSGSSFSASVHLVEGRNAITAIAADSSGRTASCTITVTLATNATITGRVTNALTGLPVPAASVTVTDAANVARIALTATDGVYGISGLAGGAFNGCVEKEGYSPQRFAGSATVGQTTVMDAVLNPIPPVISAISVTEVTVDSARIVWTTDRPADSRVEYGETAAYGSQAADETLSTSHSVLLAGLTRSTIYRFRITSTTPNGASAAAEDGTFKTKAQIGITITSPVDGASLTGQSAMVAGTVTNTSNNETGITVNGIVAPSAAGRFAVSHIPLTAGENTITVRAVDSEGTLATQSITVHAIASVHYIGIRANPESGTAPLEIKLRIGGSFGITNPSIVPTGPGPVDQLASADPDEYIYRMTTEGIYLFTVVAAGPDGILYQDTVSVAVLSATRIDALLRAKWEGMKEALSNQDIEAATSYFASHARETYKRLLEGLKPLLPQIAEELNRTAVDRISIKNNVAIYEIIVSRNGTAFSFQLQFIRDDDGVWKIFKY